MNLPDTKAAVNSEKHFGYVVSISTEPIQFIHRDILYNAECAFVSSLFALLAQNCMQHAVPLERRTSPCHTLCENHPLSAVATAVCRRRAMLVSTRRRPKFPFHDFLHRVVVSELRPPHLVAVVMPHKRTELL